MSVGFCFVTTHSYPHMLISVEHVHGYERLADMKTDSQQGHNKKEVL